MTNTILIVEGEKRLSDAVCKYFTRDGFDFLQATTGQQALDILSQNKPTLIVLDIMLPDIDGMQLCEHIRKTSNVPIIMLTARVDHNDKLIGFAKGADDYICKPFEADELMARIKAVLRRVEPLQTNSLSFGPICILIDEHKVIVDQTEVHLTQMEFQLICMLMQEPEKVFSREEILSQLHGRYSKHYERTIDTHVKNLRKKINTSSEYNYIRTIYGVGYRLL